MTCFSARQSTSTSIRIGCLALLSTGFLACLSPIGAQEDNPEAELTRLKQRIETLQKEIQARADRKNSELANLREEEKRVSDGARLLADIKKQLKEKNICAIWECNAMPFRRKSGRPIWGAATSD